MYFDIGTYKNHFLIIMCHGFSGSGFACWKALKTWLYIWQFTTMIDHYSDVIMGPMASQTTSLTMVYSTVNFRNRSKKTSKRCATGLCARNSPVTGELPAQTASNAENVSIWWRHHAFKWSMVPALPLRCLPALIWHSSNKVVWWYAATIMLHCSTWLCIHIYICIYIYLYMLILYYSFRLTQCDLVTPYGDKDLGQHRLR